MALPAVAAAAPPSLPLDANRKRKPEDDPVEEKELISSNSKEEVAFDPGPLCGAISLELSDGHTPRSAAEQILGQHPDFPLTLVHLDKEQLVTWVQNHFLISQYPEKQHKEILTTVLILYSTSLINSSIGESAKKLARDLPGMVSFTDKASVTAMIKRAKEVLALRDDQRSLESVGRLTEHINHYLNLFFYHDSVNRRRFENVYTYSDQFPTCRRYFPLLVQNLEICRSEYDELVTLRAQLLQQTIALQKQAVLALPSRRVQRLPEAREKMLEHQAVLLWDAGAELLKLGLITIFSEKRMFKTFVPQDLVNSINAVSRREFRGYSFNDLVRNGTNQLPPRFISEVWGDYLGPNSPIQDIADLMRLLIGKLPDAMFKQLETDLKTSEDKKGTVLNAINQYFTTQFRGSVTLIKLKHWLGS